MCGSARRWFQSGASGRLRNFLARARVSVSGDGLATPQLVTFRGEMLANFQMETQRL